MPPTFEQLMPALPEAEPAQPGELAETLALGSLGPVPVGRWRRLRLLGTLQAKISAAYLFYWPARPSRTGLGERPWRRKPAISRPHRGDQGASTSLSRANNSRSSSHVFSRFRWPSQAIGRLPG